MQLVLRYLDTASIACVWSRRSFRDRRLSLGVRDLCPTPSPQLHPFSSNNPDRGVGGCPWASWLAAAAEPQDGRAMMGPYEPAC